MISVEYDKKTHEMTTKIQGDSDVLLNEFHALTEHLLESFHVYGVEIQVIEEIVNVASEFTGKHILKTKGEKKDD